MPLTPRKTRKSVVLGRRHVLRELHAGGPRTTAEIAQGLAQAGIDYSQETVDTRLQELEAEGLICRDLAQQVGIRPRSTVHPPAGRPPRYATLTDAWGLGLGLEIGRIAIRAAVVTPAGNLVARSSGRRLGRHLTETLADASRHLENVLGELGEEQRSWLKGMVVAVPAPVHRQKQEGASEYFPAWGEGPLDELLAKRLDIRDIPIDVVNDAVARAISEGRFGLARASHSAFVLKVSGGIGGSLLRRGRILRGFRGYAGEIGHLGVSLSSLQPPPGRLELASLMPDARCSCDDRGGQHLEAYASTSAIARRHQPDAGPQADFDVVASTWQSEDRAAKCIEDAARLIGQVAVSVATVYDPEVIVVTGRFAACGDAALNPIKDSLRGNPLMTGDPPEVLVDGPGAPDEDGWEWVGVQGAGRLAIERNTSAEEPSGSMMP